MNLDQKKIIVQEIHHWKNSKLLPAEYCDFLLNLYMEGESFSAEEQSKATGKGSKSSAGTRTAGLWGRISLILGTLLLFLIFAFNFTSFPQPMQIITPLVAMLISYILAWRFGRGNSMVRVSWLSVGAVMAALSGYFYLATTGQLGDKSAILGIMALICFIWLVSGGIGRSRLIAGFGWGGLLLLFANFLQGAVDLAEKPYGVQHLYWLIPMLFSWFLSYLLGRWRVYVAPVFLFLGLIAVFGPELQMLSIGATMDFFIQAIVFVKLAVLVSLSIVFRGDLKQWVQQVSV